MLLRQGRRISTVLSVVKCSLAWRRRATPRLQTIYVANRGDSSLRERSPGTPRGVHPPRDSDEWSARMRLCETWDPRNEVRVEDEQGTWIRRAQDRSYDRALNQSRFVRSHARFVRGKTVTRDMIGSTVPEERSRAATRRIEFDEVLLFGDEQSKLRESASGTQETRISLEEENNYM